MALPLQQGGQANCQARAEGTHRQEIDRKSAGRTDSSPEMYECRKPRHVYLYLVTRHLAVYRHLVTRPLAVTRLPVFGRV